MKFVKSFAKMVWLSIERNGVRIVDLSVDQGPNPAIAVNIHKGRKRMTKVRRRRRECEVTIGASSQIGPSLKGEKEEKDGENADTPVNDGGAIDLDGVVPSHSGQSANLP